MDHAIATNRAGGSLSMEVSPEIQAETMKRFELVQKVATALTEIQQIVITECSAQQDRDELARTTSLSLSVKSRATAHKVTENYFIVRVMFSLHAVGMREESDKQKVVSDRPAIAIECNFVMPYGVKSMEGIEDRHLEAFAEINGVVTAWPYCREFVQSTLGRMGLPLIALPPYMSGSSALKGTVDVTAAPSSV